MEKYQVNSTKVVAETIDGEVVIVNLEKGDYYSLVKSGAQIWGKIEQNLTLSQILQQMIAEYNDSEENITKNVKGFIEILKTEGLVLVEAIDIDSYTETNSAVVENNGTGKLEFDLPTLEKYTDMEELLLLDPIHEVDEQQGWPNVKAEEQKVNS
jgi:hypothetical protein